MGMEVFDPASEKAIEEAAKFGSKAIDAGSGLAILTECSAGCPTISAASSVTGLSTSGFAVRQNFGRRPKSIYTGSV